MPRDPFNQPTGSEAESGDLAQTASLPRRRGGVEVHELAGGAVAFDPALDAVHRLDPRALLVWRACDGASAVEAIARQAGRAWALEESKARVLVQHIVDELYNRELIDDFGPPRPTGLEHGAAGTGEFSPRVGPGPAAPEERFNHRADRFTRREVVRGGVAKLVLAAPVVSTFFAQAACATQPSAHGPGGCKNVNFSCASNAECCGSGQNNTECENNECCIRLNKGVCQEDADCCAGLTCDGGGICRN